MSELWVVVADQSKARIFTVSDSSKLQPLEELAHPAARELEQNLTTDRPGRAFDSTGKGRHAMGSSVEPAKQENIRFAKHIFEHIQSAQNNGRCNRLLLVAGPPFLGLLRENLKALSGIDVSEVEKNLGQFDAMEIRKHLPKRL